MSQDNFKKGASFFQNWVLPLNAAFLKPQWPSFWMTAPLPNCRLRRCSLSRLGYCDAARNEALDRVIASAKTVSEYMNLLGSVPLLNASGLDESYKLLADFNGTVLTGHKTKQGVQFVA